MVDVRGEESEIEGFAPRILAWAGAYTILFIGFSHVLISGEHFLAATYLGILFLANGAGSVLVAFGLFLGGHRWAWLLGALITGGAFAGFIASRMIGLPGVTEFVGQWFSIAGLLTLAIEGLFLTLTLLAITPQGRSLVTVEEERIERERMVPAKQETPEHKEEIEEEMAGIRSRMTSDVIDLRKHVEPQVVKEQVERNLRERSHVILASLRARATEDGLRPLAAVLVLSAAILLARRARSDGDD